MVRFPSASPRHLHARAERRGRGARAVERTQIARCDAERNDWLGAMSNGYRHRQPTLSEDRDLHAASDDAYRMGGTAVVRELKGADRCSRIEEVSARRPFSVSTTPTIIMPTARCGAQAAGYHTIAWSVPAACRTLRDAYQDGCREWTSST